MAHEVKQEERSPTSMVRRLDPQALIEKAMEGNQGIEVLERLFQLAKEVRAEQAREAWNASMAEFQKNAPKILKTEKADMGGKFTYKYAPLEAIMNAILPLMGPLGLSVSWRNRIEPGKVISNCRISHDLGHFEESGDVPMPVMEDRMGANGAQRVGIALTYSKRYSLLSIAGLAPEDDPDAQGDDAPPEPRPMPRRASESKPPTPAGSPRVITDKQHSRLWAIAFGAAKEFGLGEQEAKDQLNAILREHGFESSKDVTEDKYEAIISELQQGSR
jgi:ERF superfamily protein